MTATRTIRALAALLALAPAAFAQQSRIDALSGGTNVNAVPTAEEERASFAVADGFEVTLFAAEPMVEKPIAINFDPAGRLWVATSNTYPQVKPGQRPDDKIYVLEDADNDGKADKSTVFAEGLLIPTGVVPGDGGAYVANSTEVVHFTDTDGDLKADGFRVVLSGFGTEDTHHIIHTFRWGPGGRLYFNQSIYIHSNVETPYGRRTMNGSGTWRYRPENAKLDVFAQGMWNPWGHAYDRYGNSFQTDGAGSGGVHHVFPGSVFVTAKDAFNKDVERKLEGLNPGSPKFCGAEMITGRHFPDDWQNNVVTNDFRANRVVRFKLEDQPDGGCFTSKPMPDVIKSTSRFFRPIDLKMGPDGALYLADWCNQIINHGEVDFRDPRRDKGHGRIWRISAKNRPPVERPKLAGAGAAELLEQLRSPEQYTREQAKIVLRSRGATAVVPELAKFASGIIPDDTASDALRLEALWVYQSLDVPEPALLRRLLKSKDYRVRAAAVRVIPDLQAKIDRSLELLETAATDESPRVRLEAVSALALIPSPAAVEVAMRAAERPVDPSLDFALWRTANLTKDLWLPAFKEGRLKFGGRVDQMARALQAVKSADAVAALVKQLREGRLPPAARADVYDLVAAVGSAEDQRVTYDAAVDPDSGAAERLRALAALDRAARGRNVRPAGVDPAKLTALFTAPDAAVAAAAVRFAGAWQPAPFRAQLEALAAAEATPLPVRAAAAESIADTGPDGADALRKLAGAAAPAAGRLLAIGALSRLDLKDASVRAADVLSTAPGGTDPAALLAAILQREGGADALDLALKDKPLPKDTAKLALRYLNTSGRNAGGLLNTIREAAGLTATAKPPTPDELAAIVTRVQAQGDAARGEQVFRRTDMACYNCHMIAGAGAAVGPDLRSIGASSPLDYIVEAILVPNKAVKEGYESLIVATKKGDVFSGIRVSKDDQQLVLRDATHERIAIPLADIKRQKDGGSLMPAGLADTLTEPEFLDLCRFLSELGKPGPFAADKPNVVRRWRIVDNADALSHAEGPGSDSLPWRPAYSLVAGILPSDTAKGTTALARAEFDVTAAGRIAFALNDVAGISALFIDNQAVNIAGVGPALTGPLALGRHAITVAFDPSKRGGAGLQLELRDAPNETGRAQPAGGR
jgi:putative heme-binding domain-containing protein